MIGYSTVTSKGQITLPAKIRKALKLSPGKKVMIIQEAGSAVVKSADEDFWSLEGSVKPVRKLNPRAMRKAFIKYLGTRRHEDDHR